MLSRLSLGKARAPGRWTVPGRRHLPGFLIPPLALLAVLWAILGAGQALVAIPSSTLLAEHSFPEERGKVFAAHFALTHACWPVTYPVVGREQARLPPRR